MKRQIWIAAALLLAASSTVHAQDAYVTVDLNLRSAPDSAYPSITVLPAGTRVSVQGCIDDWLWCDVVAYGDRGWVAGDYIEYVYRDRRVPLVSYGARIGIPIVSFVIGDYWGRHYSHRPFYRDRNRWYKRHIDYGHHHRGRDWDHGRHDRRDGRHDGRRDRRDHDRGRDHGRDNRHDRDRDHHASSATQRSAPTNSRAEQRVTVRTTNMRGRSGSQ
jgi:uncharacterized protein YraI